MAAELVQGYIRSSTFKLHTASTRRPSWDSLHVNRMLVLTWRRKVDLSAFRPGESKHIRHTWDYKTNRSGYLNSLPSSRDGIDVAEVMKDTLGRDPDALTLERGVGVAGGLRGSLADLPRAKAPGALSQFAFQTR